MSLKLSPKTLYPLVVGILVISLVAIVLFSNKGKKEFSNNSVENSEVSQGSGAQMKNGVAPSKENLSPNYTSELTKYKSAFEKNPNDTLAIREYADFLAASHKPIPAKELYNKILKLNPKRIDILYVLAAIAIDEKDFTSAYANLQKVHKYAPGNIEALFDLGGVSTELGKNDEAKKYFEEVISKNPGSELAVESAKMLKKLVK